MIDWSVVGAMVASSVVVTGIYVSVVVGVRDWRWRCLKRDFSRYYDDFYAAQRAHLLHSPTNPDPHTLPEFQTRKRVLEMRLERMRRASN